LEGHGIGLVAWDTKNCSRYLRQPMTTPVRLNTNPTPNNMTISALRNVGHADNIGSVCSAL
jgi:hypothetical protein